jgi:hypothetical protein
MSCSRRGNQQPCLVRLDGESEEMGLVSDPSAVRKAVGHCVEDVVSQVGCSGWLVRVRVWSVKERMTRLQLLAIAARHPNRAELGDSGPLGVSSSLGQPGGHVSPRLARAAKRRPSSESKPGAVVLLSTGETRSGSGGRTSREVTYLRHYALRGGHACLRRRNFGLRSVAEVLKRPSQLDATFVTSRIRGRRVAAGQHHHRQRLAYQPTTEGAARPALEAVRPAARSAQHHRWPSASRPISSRGLGRRHWETALRL